MSHAKMTQNKRKRPATEHDLDQAIKALRRNSGQKKHIDTPKIFEHSPPNPILQESLGDNTTSTPLNSAGWSPNTPPPTKRLTWPTISYGTKIPDILMTNTPPQTSPFKYQPLEEYRKAEALRLVFIKHGLDYKKPQLDLDLLGEDALSTYMTRWEECLDHWYPILGVETPTKQTVFNRSDLSILSPTNTLDSDSTEHLHHHNLMAGELATPNGLFPEIGFGQHRHHHAHQNKIVSLFGSLSSEDARPLFNPPTIVKWGDSLFDRNYLRQIIESEVRRQLLEK